MKMKVADILRRSSEEDMANIIGAIVMMGRGYSVEEALEIPYENTLKALQKEMEVKWESLTEEICLNKWILISESLPEYDQEHFERYGEDREYIVTIKGAEASTVLCFGEDGCWYDLEDNIYPVAAWMQMPLAYNQTYTPERRRNEG